MPKLSELFPSRFLTKEDCEPPILLTITGVKVDNVGTDDKPDNKPTLIFAEAKSLVLNWTNAQICEQIFGSDDLDKWVGGKVVAYCDHTIMFKGELKGGVRLRAPVKKAQAAPAKLARRGDPHPSEPLPAEADSDDVPF
jgi:hypothetical protein